MLVDEDLLAPEDAISTSVSGFALVAQTWTASASGQLIEIRVIGDSNKAIWPSNNRLRIYRTTESGAPDTSEVLAHGDSLYLEQRSVPGDLVVYAIEDVLRVSAGDKLAAVFALGSCLFATTNGGKGGLWTASDAPYAWHSEGANSLRFMSVVRE